MIICQPHVDVCVRPSTTATTGYLRLDHRADNRISTTIAIRKGTVASIPRHERIAARPRMIVIYQNQRLQLDRYWSQPRPMTTIRITHGIPAAIDDKSGDRVLPA